MLTSRLASRNFMQGAGQRRVNRYAAHHMLRQTREAADLALFRLSGQ